MRVVPRRYAWCIECDSKTVQWLVDAPEPRIGHWGSRKPAQYRCHACGRENY